MATRLFVPSNYRPSEKYAAFGVLALSGPPTGADEARRYKWICEAYLTIFDDSSMVEAISPDVVQMITIWPRFDLTKTQSFDPTTSNLDLECERAISRYSYPAAHIWMKKVEARGAHIAVGRGPFLVAWARSPEGTNAPGSVLTLDLSMMNSQADIENAFRLWKNEIEKHPQSWSDAWRPAKWKLFVASSLNAYGQQIIDAITIVKHVGLIG
jgi:hypothetical protein